MDFKQQLQYAYLNDRPRLFEELIDKTISEIDDHIIDLTKRKIFELIIIFNRKGFSGDVLSIVNHAYEERLENEDLKYHMICLEDEEMLGYSDSDLMDAIYDYYEDISGIHLQGNKTKHMYFSIEWSSIIKQRTDLFTDAELLFDEFVEAIKENDHQYNTFVESMKYKVRECILFAARDHKSEIELKLECVDDEITLLDTLFPYTISMKEKDLCGYDIRTLAADIRLYLESLEISVSANMKFEESNNSKICLLGIDLSDIYSLH